MNRQWLKVKTAGMPRWAWISLASGAVLLGLYLRTRSEGEPEEEVEEMEPSADQMEYYDGTDSAGGLASAGLVGPAMGGLTPVQAPYIPEGLTEIFQGQGETISILGETISNREPSERVETIREIEPPIITGGGAPNRKPAQNTAAKRRAAKRKAEAAAARRLSAKAKAARKKGNKKGARKLAKAAQKRSRRAKSLR